MRIPPLAPGSVSSAQPDRRVAPATETPAASAPPPLTLAPPLAEVPLPARNVGVPAAAQRARDEPYAGRPALRFGDRIWTHAELLAEAEGFAALFRTRLDSGRPPHVAVLLDNTPDYVFALCGAGLAGATVVGLNHTRRDEHLARDISHTDVQLVITEPRHQALLADARRRRRPAGRRPRLGSLRRRRRSPGPR